MTRSTLNRGHQNVPLEPTRKMMEAGAKALQDSGIAENDAPRYPSAADALVAADIYKAMLKASPTR